MRAHPHRRGSPSGRPSLWLERFCLGAGSLALFALPIVYLDAWYGSRTALADFERRIESRPAATAPAARPAAIPPVEEPAVADLPDERPPQGGPIAVLRVPRLDVEVPVFDGTDQRTLNRGAGLVEGTAVPGATGNTVISAHRDSFFRPLKDLAVGDVVELQASDGSVHRFAVSELFVTDPLDVSVLDGSTEPRLTLITCYPFSYVGFAPERLIVRAEFMTPTTI